MAAALKTQQKTTFPASVACQRRSVSNPVFASAPPRRMVAARAAEILSKSSESARRSVLSAVADLCEIQGATSKFESFAGRSAMLGLSVALGVEVLTDHSFLAPLPDAQLYAGLAALSIVLASAVAAFQSAARGARQEAPALLEPVISSLTAVQRSGASLTAMEGANKDSLDQAVDNVLNTTFTRARLDLITDAAFYVDL